MSAVPTQDIKNGLRLIRLRQRRLIGIFLGFLPAMFATAYIVRLVSDSETPVLYAAAVYGGLFLAYGCRLAFTECPQCHGYYHWSWWSNPWTRKCLNCGLPLKVADGN